MNHNFSLHAENQYSLYRGLQCLPNLNRFEEFIEFLASSDFEAETTSPLNSGELLQCFHAQPTPYQCLNEILEKHTKNIFPEPSPAQEEPAQKICRRLARWGEQILRDKDTALEYRWDHEFGRQEYSEFSLLEQSALKKVVRFYQNKFNLMEWEEETQPRDEEEERNKIVEKNCSLYLHGETCGGFNIGTKITMGAGLFYDSGGLQEYGTGILNLHLGYRHFSNQFQGWAWEVGALGEIGARNGDFGKQEEIHGYYNHALAFQGEYHFGNSTIESQQFHPGIYFGAEAGVWTWKEHPHLRGNEFFGGIQGGIGFFYLNQSFGGIQIQARGGYQKWLDASVWIYFNPLAYFGTIISVLADPDIDPPYN